MTFSCIPINLKWIQIKPSSVKPKWAGSKQVYCCSSFCCCWCLKYLRLNESKMCWVIVCVCARVWVDKVQVQVYPFFCEKKNKLCFVCVCVLKCHHNERSIRRNVHEGKFIKWDDIQNKTKINNSKIHANTKRKTEIYTIKKCYVIKTRKKHSRTGLCSIYK